MSPWTRLLALFGFTSHDRTVAEELEAHRAHAQDELQRAGWSPEEAIAESRRRMGNVLLAREDSRDVWVVRWMDRLRQHLKYGVRGLLREPMFALTVVLTLGLGSAATITVFSVVDAEAWRPLPYPQPHRLIAARMLGTGANATTEGISPAELQDWRAAATAFESLAAGGNVGRRTAQLGHAESLYVNEVTASYFTTLGRKPIAGRVFAPDDAAGAQVAVLTTRAWERVFDRDPGIVGRSILLDGQPVAIVGLVARDDSMGADADVYLPIDERRSTAPLFGVIGRLKDGASIDAGRAQLQAAVDRRDSTDVSSRHHRVDTEDLSSFYRREDQRTLFFFLGAAVVVMVMTVVNVAGLLTARAMRRRQEFALRGALGGGTAALVAQTMVEGALIAAPGCGVGLLLSYLSLGAVGRFVPAEMLLRGNALHLDMRSAAFTFTIAAASAVVLALVPLGIARRAAARQSLGSGTRVSDTPRAARLRRVLLVSQLALTVVLLFGGGVFLESFVALTSVPLGFQPERAWSMSVTLTGPAYATPEAIRGYVDTAVEKLRAVPGVRAAAPASSSPLNSGWLGMVTPRERRAVQARSIVRVVGAAYFDATGTPIVRGRGITAEDRAGGPVVMVVNQLFVDQVFPGEDPIGKQVDFSGLHAAPVGQGTATIVGVVGNVKDIFLNEAGMPNVYLPFAQKPHYRVEFLVRSEGSDNGVAAALRAALADPLVPVSAVSSLSGRVDHALEADRFNLIVVAGFAAMALLMSGIAIYGAMAYSASSQRRDFGVRLAFGATPRDLVTHMLGECARIAGIAAVIGAAGVFALSRALGSALYLVPGAHNGLLYNVTTTDPAALTMALAGIVVLAIAAGTIPALRGSRVDPSTALRSE